MAVLLSHSLWRTPTSEKPNFEQVTHSHTVRRYQVSVQVTNLPPPPLCDTSEPTAKQPGRGWWRGCLRQRTAREGWVKGTKTKTKATEVAFFSPLIATCHQGESHVHHYLASVVWVSVDSCFCSLEKPWEVSLPHHWKKRCEPPHFCSRVNYCNLLFIVKGSRLTAKSSWSIWQRWQTTFITDLERLRKSYTWIFD